MKSAKVILLGLVLLVLSLPGSPVLAQEGSGLTNEKAAGPNTAPVVPGFAIDGDGATFTAVDQQGRRWAVWSYRRGKELNIAISRGVGRGWSLPELLDLPALDDVDPRITFLNDGTPVVVWCQRGGTPYNRIVAAYLIRGKWVGPIQISGQGEATSPNIFPSTEGPIVGFMDTNNRLLSSPLSNTMPVFGGSNGPDPIPTLVPTEPDPYHGW